MVKNAQPLYLLPKAITSVGQGAIAATTGDYRNMKTGVKTNDVEAWEGIIKMLDLRRPIYKQTAAYGHFGRNDLDLPWEKLDKVDVLKKYL